MKARHSIFTREISSPPCNIVQMKICNDDLLPRVARLPLFAGCASGAIKSILEDVQGKLRQFDAGEVILHECMPAVLMVVVVSGVVFVRECGLTDDSRHLVQRLYAGGTFGATFPAGTVNSPNISVSIARRFTAPSPSCASPARSALRTTPLPSREIFARQF